MIRRSHIVGVILSLASVSSWATGFYIGAGAGPDFARIRMTSHVKGVFRGFTNFNVKNDNDLSGTGAFGTIFVGYGLKLSELGFQPSNIYLAAELNANGSSLEHQNINHEFVHHNFATTTYRTPYSFGASIIPGYFYMDTTLFYGRVGYVNGNFRASTNEVLLADFNRNLSGFRWGLGLQQFVIPQLAVRVEYSNTSYDDMTIREFAPGPGVSKTTQYTPHVNEVEFGLVYRFC